MILNSNKMEKTMVYKRKTVDTWLIGAMHDGRWIVVRENMSQDQGQISLDFCRGEYPQCDWEIRKIRSSTLGMTEDEIKAITVIFCDHDYHDTVKCNTSCPFCKQDFVVVTTLEGYIEWTSGTLIQNAMPDSTPDEREQLISGTCPKCWDIQFADD